MVSFCRNKIDALDFYGKKEIDFRLLNIHFLSISHIFTTVMRGIENSHTNKMPHSNDKIDRTIFPITLPLLQSKRKPELVALPARAAAKTSKPHLYHLLILSF